MKLNHPPMSILKRTMKEDVAKIAQGLLATLFNAMAISRYTNGTANRMHILNIIATLGSLEIHETLQHITLYKSNEPYMMILWYDMGSRVYINHDGTIDHIDEYDSTSGTIVRKDAIYP